MNADRTSAPSRSSSMRLISSNARVFPPPIPRTVPKIFFALWPDSSLEASKTLNVLIVEDSAVCRRMTVKLVQKLQFTSAEAEDGLQAVQMVEASLRLGEKKEQGKGESGEDSLTANTGTVQHYSKSIVKL